MGVMGGTQHSRLVVNPETVRRHPCPLTALSLRKNETGADENLTPLHFAALEGASVAVDSPLARGANPNATNGYGRR